MKIKGLISVFLVVLLAIAVVGSGCRKKAGDANLTLGVEPGTAQGDVQPELVEDEGETFTVNAVKLILPNGEEVDLDSKRINRFSKIKVIYDGDLGDAEPRLQPYVELVPETDNTGERTYTHTMPFHHMMSYSLTLGSSEHKFVSAPPADVDGDGSSDILEGMVNISLVSLFFGGKTSVTGQLFFSGVMLVNPQWGKSLALSDVNGDGYADIIIGAPLQDDGKGCLYVFHGRPREAFPAAPGMDATQADTTICRSTTTPGMFTAKIATGDVDGDGFGDVIVGEPIRRAGDLDHQDPDVSHLNAGAVHILRGSKEGLGTGARDVTEFRVESNAYLDQIFFSGQQDRFLGWSVAAGDVDADGKDEIIVGAPGSDEEFSLIPGVSHDCIPGNVYIIPGDIDQYRAIINSVGDELEGMGCMGGAKDSFGYIVAPARVVMEDNPYKDAIIIGTKDRSYRFVQRDAETQELLAGPLPAGTEKIVELRPGYVAFAVSLQNYVELCVGGVICNTKYTGQGGEGGSARFGSALAPAGNFIGGTFAYVIGEMNYDREEPVGTPTGEIIGAVHVYNYIQSENRFGSEAQFGNQTMRIGNELAGGRIR